MHFFWFPTWGGFKGITFLSFYFKFGRSVSTRKEQKFYKRGIMLLPEMWQKVLDQNLSDQLGKYTFRKPVGKLNESNLSTPQCNCGSFLPSYIVATNFIVYVWMIGLLVIISYEFQEINSLFKFPSLPHIFGVSASFVSANYFVAYHADNFYS